MDNIGYYAKRVRNRVAYIRADCTQKYYSTSKNPRVVQTRLNHVASLRTCQEKYDIEPGEFLALDRDERQRKAYDRETRVIESAPPRLAEAEMIPNANGCKCECHQSVDCNRPERTKKSWFGFKHKDSEPAIDQPSIEINSALVAQDTQDLIELHQQLQENNKHTIPEISWIKTPLSPGKDSPYKRLLRQYSFAEGTRLSSSESNQVWKSVLNDVSLSAARISTGAPATSKTYLEPISADFTREDWYDLISYYAYSE